MSNRRIPFFILILASIAMAGTTFAQTYPASAAVPAGAVAVALLALTFSFDVVALGYIISKIFPQTGINEWLPNEYWEIAKSAILIVSIYALLAFATNVSTSLIPTSLSTGLANGGSGCPNTPGSSTYVLVNSACYYLNTLNSQLSLSFTNLMGLSGALGALGNTGISIFTPLPLPGIVGFKFGFSASIYKNSLLEGNAQQFQSILNDFLTFIAFPMALLVNIQLNFITFVFLAGIYVLIPLGLMFRAMPFTRGIGGALIGIGIGVSIVYPSMLVLLNYPVTTTFSAVQGASGSCTAGILCGFIGMIMSPFTGAWLAISSMNSIFPALNMIVDTNGYLLLQFLLFVVDLGIGYSVANGVARVLGGQIRYSITDKIKLA